MTAGPCLLAIDTSTETLVVALASPRGHHTRQEAGGAQASARLLPCIHELLAEAGLVLADLDAIAYGQGPGAFTGLRTSCAVAQGLGLGLDLPLLPLDSLLIVAEDARGRLGLDAADIAVAMDARMDEAYAARYRWAAGGWQAHSAPGLYGLPVLAAAWAAEPPPVVAGTALAAFGSRLGLGPATRCMPEAHDRAAALLRLALAQHARGNTVAADDALPLYLRDRVAQTTAERAAVRAAAAGAP